MHMNMGKMTGEQWDRVQEIIRHENGLIHQRASALFQSSAIAIPIITVVFTYKDGIASVSGTAFFLLIFIAYSLYCIASSFVALCLVLSAQRHICICKECVRKWIAGDDIPSYPPVTGVLTSPLVVFFNIEWCVVPHEKYDDVYSFYEKEFGGWQSRFHGAHMAILLHMILWAIVMLGGIFYFILP